jgi:hypothetical protein
MAAEHIELDADEREVWRAAYAAAFVERFARNREMSSGGGFNGIDEAYRITDAEVPIGIANAAVIALRVWRALEDSFADIRVPLPPADDEGGR